MADAVIKELKELAEELDFQLMVCEATSTTSVSLTYKNACKLYHIVKGLIKNHTERK